MQRPLSNQEKQVWVKQMKGQGMLGPVWFTVSGIYSTSLGSYGESEQEAGVTASLGSCTSLHSAISSSDPDHSLLSFLSSPRPH